MSSRHQRLRRTTFLLIAVATAAIALVAHATDVVRPLGLQSVDVRFAIRGPEPVPAGVAVVAIDDVTFEELGEQWPFPRSLHGQVIKRLKADGAKVIAYDVQFTEATEAAEDAALYEAIKAGAPVVLSTTETSEDGGTNVLGGDDVVASAGARAASTLLDADGNDVNRTVPHTVDRLETFAVVATELADGRQVSKARFTEPGDRAWIDFAGPPGRILTVPFSRVLRGQFKRGTFRDRIVVVGATAASLQDIHATSTTTGEALMPGPEIQASAIDTVRRGLPLQSAPGWVAALLIVVMAVAVPLATLWLRFRWVLTLAVVLGAAYAGASIGAFGGDLILPVAVPLLALALATVTSTAGYALLTAAERQRTRDLFARFVPEAVVNDVLAKADDDLRLGGQRKEGTVMFCDLRGFTSFAERLDPDRVIEVLNQYLSEMSDAIMEQEGTLVAFMGDGIMAVFGAPLDRADHADRAVRAAQDMVDVRLPRFNAWLERQGLDHAFRMGIGINSGPVMSGNVGSSTRVEYTAIGDTTNTASRIESMTKDEDAQVLLSESTRAAMIDDGRRAALRSVGERAVRGRDQRIVLWTLTS